MFNSTILFHKISLGFISSVIILAVIGYFLLTKTNENDSTNSEASDVVNQNGANEVLYYVLQKEINRTVAGF